MTQFARQSLHLTARLVWFGGLVKYGRRLGLSIPKWIMRGWFNTVSQVTVLGLGEEVTCLNYGYADTTPDQHSSSAPGNTTSLRLYGSLVDMLGANALADRDVLEVGSGRGGGANFIAETCQPRRMTGVELSPDAVSFCRNHYEAPNLQFRQGDAMCLDFPDESFDVVINVESAHCYPDFGAFVAGVHRVLRPGGHLLLTDCVRATRMPRFRAALHSQPWAAHQETDITDNVIAALIADSDRKTRLIEKTGLPSIIRRHLRELSACAGSRFLSRFQSRALLYTSFCFEKAGGGEIVEV